MLDIIIRNGLLVDGSGAPARQADIAVQGDQIVEIGNLPDAAAFTVIDAAGKIVAPGFIDMHSHHDTIQPVAQTADSLVHQGITTIITGNCGISPTPLGDKTRKEYIAQMGEIPGLPMPWDELSDFGSFLNYVDKKGTGPNLIGLVGQGTVRAAVIGFTANRPSEEQMEQMQKMVTESMEAGAIGVSTGLIYPPGSYASTEELIEITRPVGARGGIYFSHIRGESDTLLEAISEAIEIGRKTGAAVQISHYKAAGPANWDKAERGLDLIENARAEGMDVTADMYPYLAGATGLVSLLPEWAQEDGQAAIASRLKDPATRVKMVESMKATGFFSFATFDKILISDARNSAYAGHFVSELAEAAGKSGYDWVFDALLETNGEIGMIVFMMSEDNVRKQLLRPWMMVGTDAAGISTTGPLSSGVPHPRSFGTFPKVLGTYARDEKVITLEDAVYKMTGLPAKKLRLKDRGFLHKGLKADLVVFDPKTVADVSTYQKPAVYPTGIDYVVVNGEFVVRQGVGTKAMPGHVLRPF
jgi:N-acyl-D-amino-acid deacylase